MRWAHLRPHANHVLHIHDATFCIIGDDVWEVANLRAWEVLATIPSKFCGAFPRSQSPQFADILLAQHLCSHGKCRNTKNYPVSVPDHYSDRRLRVQPVPYSLKGK
jgi:hypothetical protein